MSNMNALVKLGQFMIKHAPKFEDDATFNRWARAGQLLTGLGMPFAPKVREFDEVDQQTVLEAAAVIAGKSEMPKQRTLEPQQDEEEDAPRRTRKARMTKAMTKERAPRVVKPKAKTVKAKVVKAKTVKEASAKKRGRPPGSKNKPKVVVKATGTVRKSR
jgi:hypothetical protein